MRTIICTLFIVSFATPAVAADVPVPPMGTTLTYECSGPYYKERVSKFMGSKDGKARWEFTNDGKRGYAVMQHGLWGSMLNYERDNGDGKGRRTMEWDASDVAGYDPLTAGSSMDVDVKTVARDWRANESIKVRVAKRGPMKVAQLGEIDAVKIVNSRQMRGHLNKWNYSSSMDVWVDTEKGVAVKWVYKDDKGKQVCDLTKAKFGS